MLLYPSNTDFRWMIYTNHIKNYDVTVIYIYISQYIWVKYIDALTFKTAHTKPKPVSGGMINIPKELIEFKKTVFLAVYLFFVNGIPFFISLSRKIDFKYFTGVSHLPGRKAREIFNFSKQFTYTNYIGGLGLKPCTQMENFN